MKRIICVVFILFILAIGVVGYKSIVHVRHLYYQMLGLIEYVVNEESAHAYSLHTLQENTKTMLRNAMDVPFAFDYSWISKGNHLICHAMGQLDDETYTNSLEAFLTSYDKGYRVFEVDFELTAAENALILTHDAYWAGDGDNNWQKFMDSSGLNYTRMDIRSLCELMKQYPDIYIITDTKYTDAESIKMEFAQIVYTAKQVEFTILDRIIPQVYNEEMLYTIMNMYPFSSVIYTLYMASERDDQAVLDFCQRTGVRFVTVPIWDNVNGVKAWKNDGLIVATHTINDKEQAMELLNMGFDMIYTDNLNPHDYGE